MLTPFDVDVGRLACERVAIVERLMNKIEEQMLDEARVIIERTIESGHHPDEAAPELDAMIDAKLAINKTADDKRATFIVVPKDAC